MRRPRTYARRLPAIIALASVVLAAWVAAGGAASSSVTVTMDVPSAISLTNDCTDPAGYRFGTVQPGIPALTSTASATACAVDFVSTNDSAMLRASQADGTQGTAAMSSSPLAWSSVTSGSGMLYDVSFAPGTTTGWAVGSGGTLLRSTDGGDSWLPHACGVCGGNTLISVSAVTATNVFIGGVGGRIYRWNGTIWEQLPLPTPANDVVAMDAVDGSNIWIASTGGYMYKTTNAHLAVGSVTWTAYQPTTNDFLGLDAVSANVVFAVGNGATIARTTNGGGDLTAAALGSGSMRDVAATSATSAIAISSGGTAWETSNGTSWNGHTTGVRELLNEVVSNGATAYAVSEHGRVVKSTDSGVSWPTMVQTDTGDMLYGVSIVNASSTVVVVGEGKNIQRTTNDTDWAFEHTTAPNYLSVTAIDGTEAFAVGDYGTIARTTNWGTAWTPQTSNTTETLRSVSSTGTAGDRLIAVGDTGTVVTTIDGGTTWTPRTSGTTQRLRGVAMVDDHYAWAVGDGGTILRTSNGGTSWTAQTSGTAWTLHSVAAVSKDVAWAVGGQGFGNGNRIILGTTNGGATWTTQHTNTGSEAVSVSAVSPTTAMAVDLAGRVYRTTDGGANWTSTLFGSGRTWSIVMVSEDVAYMHLYDRPYRTADGGVTWSAITGVTWQEYRGIDAIDGDTVIGVGGGGNTGISTGGTIVTDYGAGPNNWAGASTAGLFGICLHDVTAGTTAVWTEDSTGGCTAVDTDPWRALPTAPSKVATVATPGTTGRAEFVFGVRPAENQAPGVYYAAVTFEALAPNA